MKIFDNPFQTPVQSKTFIYSILSLLLFIFIFHTTIWFLFTKTLLNTPKGHYIGDLVRLSYQISSLHYRKDNETTLLKRHIESKNWSEEHCDIITIGDSVSNAGAGGLNPYYQDYIATNFPTKKVLNIAPSPLDDNYIELIIGLINNGTLNDIQPKVLILESIERDTISMFTKQIRWDYEPSKEESRINFKNPIIHRNIQKNISIINNGNYKFLYNTFLYSLHSIPFKQENVYKASLKQPLFSIKDKSTLLFYSGDIDNISQTTPENIKIVNNNLNKLANILKAHNIKLVFMPVVDKYNLYFDFIKDNLLPTSTFFEQFSSLHKDYFFINTKKILQPLLPLCKDLYYSDDTHWSFKAAEKVIKELPLAKLLKIKEDE